MSHIGKQPIKIPQNVQFSQENYIITIKGKEGILTKNCPTFLEIKEEMGTLNIKIKPEFVGIKEYENMWGTFRTLLQNMVIGVSQGWTVKLLLVGIGFRAKVENQILVLRLGFSHNVEYLIPSDIKINCIKPTLISVFGVNYETVTKVAAEIRSFKKTEPYKGKGIRYLNEVIITKEVKKK